MDYELDCRGVACPEPVMRCRALVDKEHPARLAVLVDNSAARENVTRFLQRGGYCVTALERPDPGVGERGGTVWRVQAVADGAACAEPAAGFGRARGDGRTLVLITTETLGRGDEALGEKLMGNFLATLPELGESLWRVVLLNGGVKLAAREGKALDSLKALEAAGVSVLVCGTCLDHYALLEAKAVGETTNMLDIVTSLAVADKVIRP